jgi:hypothetical protein
MAKPLNLEFGQQNWQDAHETWQAWWDGRLERPIVVCEGYKQFGWHEQHPDARPKPNWTFAGFYALDMPIDEVLDRYEAIFEAAYFLGDGLPKFYINLGPGVLAALLGSEYEFVDSSTWFSPPTVNGVSWEHTPLDQIDLSLNLEHPLWQRICTLTAAGIERWGSQLVYGITDLGGNLDILASLIGAQRLAIEMVEQPQAVERMCAQIRRAWLECYQIQHSIIDRAGMGSCGWSCLWAPKPMYMLQSDFAYMISSAMFRRFVMPDLAACCETIAYPFYHLDGKGQIRHLDQLLALEKLRGIQWVAGDGAPPAEEWLDLLRRIRDGGKLCQVYTSVAGARKIINALGGKGFAFEITDDLTSDKAQHAYEELTHG